MKELLEIFQWKKKKTLSTTKTEFAVNIADVLVSTLTTGHGSIASVIGRFLYLAV